MTLGKLLNLFMLQFPYLREAVEIMSINTVLHWPQISCQGFHNIVWKNPNKLLGQPNTYKALNTWRKLDFPGGSDAKASAYNVGDPGSISGLGRSPGEGNGNPLQYSCLENSMDGGAW